MYQKSIETIANALSLTWSGKGDIIPTGVQFDSRMVKPGDLFVAIRGHRVDGAAFIPQALEKGAVAIVAPANCNASEAGAHIHCNDGTLFIQELARWMRRFFDGPIVAITGSQGKTSTKDLLTHILMQEHDLVVTAENQNNELGLPLTLTRLTEETSAVILEMGMSGFGEIEFLAELARPTHAIITNIGMVHAELLGSQAGIARAKTELLKYLPKNGTISVRDNDYKWILPYIDECDAEFLWTGDICRFPNQYHAEAEDVLLKQESVQFVYKDNKKCFFPVTLSYAGRHFIENSLLVISMALSLGVQPNVIQKALAAARPLSKNRMEKIIDGDMLILNDCYNANPASMQATLEVLAGYAPRQTFACLGNMYELGQYEVSGHHAVGEAVVREGINGLVTVGDLAKLIADAALDVGMPEAQVWSVDNNNDAIKILKEKMSSDAVVLVKGSNSMNMIDIVNGLISGAE